MKGSVLLSRSCKYSADFTKFSLRLSFSFHGSSLVFLLFLPFYQCIVALGPSWKFVIVDFSKAFIVTVIV